MNSFIALDFEEVGFIRQNPLLHTHTFFFFSNVAVRSQMIVGLLLIYCHFCKSDLCSRFPFLSLDPPVLALIISSLAASL